MSVAEATTLSTTLDVDGATTLDTTLNVLGLSTLAGYTSSASSTVSSAFTVASGAANVSIDTNSGQTITIGATSDTINIGNAGATVTITGDLDITDAIGFGDITSKSLMLESGLATVTGHAGFWVLVAETSGAETKTLTINGAASADSIGSYSTNDVNVVLLTNNGRYYIEAVVIGADTNDSQDEFACYKFSAFCSVSSAGLVTSQAGTNKEIVKETTAGWDANMTYVNLANTSNAYIKIEVTSLAANVSIDWIAHVKTLYVSA